MKKLIAMLLAVTLVLALAACNNTEAPASTPNNQNENPVDETPKAMTYAEYEAAEEGALVTVECYVQAKQGWWFDSSANRGKLVVYAQDADGAYFLYDLVCTEEEAANVTVGTKLRVTGDKVNFNGMVEVKDGTFEIIEGDTFIAEAMDATALLGTDDLIKHMGKKVSFKGATVVAKNDEGAAFLYKWNGAGTAGDDLYFDVSINGATYTFCVESYLTGDGTDVYEAVEALKVGDKIDMEGFLYWYEGPQPHITAVAAAA